MTQFSSGGYPGGILGSRHRHSQCGQADADAFNSLQQSTHSCTVAEVIKESGAPGVDRGGPRGNPRKQHPRSPSPSTKESKTIETLEFFLGPI